MLTVWVFDCLRACYTTQGAVLSGARRWFRGSELRVLRTYESEF